MNELLPIFYYEQIGFKVIANAVGIVLTISDWFVDLRDLKRVTDRSLRINLGRMKVVLWWRCTTTVGTLENIDHTTPQCISFQMPTWLTHIFHESEQIFIDSWTLVEIVERGICAEVGNYCWLYKTARPLSSFTGQYKLFWVGMRIIFTNKMFKSTRF